MSWLSPLDCKLEAKILRHDGTQMPKTAKEVVIEGVRYSSMAEACKALKCSYSKIYRAIGEPWRYAK